MMGRWVRRFVPGFLLIGLAAAGLIGADPGTANAQVPNPFADCAGLTDAKSAPEPTRPDEGLASFFGVDMTPPANTEDPFTDGATVSIVDAYGYGGLRWQTYDHCVPNPWDESLTGLGNLVMSLGPIPTVEATGAVGAFGEDPQMLGALDGPLTTIQTGIGEHPVKVLLPIALALVGLIYLIRHRQMAAHETAHHSFGVVLLLGLLAFLILQPLFLVHLGDSGIRTFTDAAKAAMGSQSGPLSNVSGVHEQMLYNTWLAGQLGTADSATARQFGPRLFKAGTFSKAEWAQIANDPEAQRKARDDKKTAWKAVAQEIKDTDPDAYLNLTGQRGETRVGRAFLAAISVPWACLFQFVAMVLFVVAMVTLRYVVIAAPLAVVGAMVPGVNRLFRPHLLVLGNLLSTAVMRAFTYYLAAGATALFVGAVFKAPTRSPFLMILLVAVINMVAWGFMVHFWVKHGVMYGRVIHKRVTQSKKDELERARQASHTAVMGRVATALEGLAGGEGGTVLTAVEEAV